MDLTDTLIIMIPLVLVASLLVYSAREAAEGRGFKAVRETVPAIIVLMVAMTVIILMGNASSFVWDEDSGELTIKMSIPHQDVQPWDEYANEVKSLVIEDGVTIGSGTFDSLTSLEYVSIGKDVTLGFNVFGVSLKDPFGGSTYSAGEYAGFGDGTVYLCDPDLFTYSSSGNTITGLASEGASMVYLVIPSDKGGAQVTAIGSSAFASNATIERALGLPSSRLSSIGYHAFHTCTALEDVIVPDSVTSFAYGAFQNCSALAFIDMPSRMTSIGNNALDACSALTSIEIPAGITTIAAASFRGTGITSLTIPAGVTTISFAAFQNCTALTTVSLPGSINTIAGNVFIGCTGITSVQFGNMSPSASLSSSWTGWRFYASDGTTELDRSVASNLANKTFQGINTALIELQSGDITLTPDQLQQVQLHTQELQTQVLDIQPLPFQPTLQTQEQEPISA